MAWKRLSSAPSQISWNRSCSAGVKSSPRTSSQERLESQPCVGIGEAPPSGRCVCQFCHDGGSEDCLNAIPVHSMRAEGFSMHREIAQKMIFALKHGLSWRSFLLTSPLVSLGMKPSADLPVQVEWSLSGLSAS